MIVVVVVVAVVVVVVVVVVVGGGGGGVVVVVVVVVVARSIRRGREGLRPSCSVQTRVPSRIRKRLVFSCAFR